MFDRSLLPAARFEFAVIADTHYMRAADGQPVEFESRLKQTRRAEAAFRLAAALECPFAVHMGDLVQEYPDTAEFPLAMAEALSQLELTGLAPYHVAGNHDVGDKPDPTMPTRPVTDDSLAAYEKRLGASWYSFDHQDSHFIVLNSQILNTELRAAERQRAWFEQDLAAHTHQRLFVFLHLPPFVCRPDEPSFGHYDNIAEPARGWLLEQLRQHQVELLLAAHVHCAFFDKLDRTRYLICNSTSFTRPGFPQMFASAPPPDRGRDDTAKLGFYLLRVSDTRTDVHFLRTSGVESAGTTARPLARRVITRTSATLHGSPLGVNCRHPLSTITEIPQAWPSAIRQQVRNDYPLMGCLELGAATVRVPASDLHDSFLAGRLELLRDEGVTVVGTSIWTPDLDLASGLEHLCGLVDGWELQLAGSLLPAETARDQLREARGGSPWISLSTIVPHEIVGGKQHPRTRFGFRLDELTKLNDQLREAGCPVERAACCLDGMNDFVAQMDEMRPRLPFDSIQGIDFLLDLPAEDDQLNACQAVSALFATFPLANCRLFIGPMLDFDRTMDVTFGLLDRLCNPRPVFHALRVLNSILTATAEKYPTVQPVATRSKLDGMRVLQFPSERLILLLGNQQAEAGGHNDLLERLGEVLCGGLQIKAYELARATVELLSVPEAIPWSQERITSSSALPCLLVVEQ